MKRASCRLSGVFAGKRRCRDYSVQPFFFIEHRSLQVKTHELKSRTFCLAEPVPVTTKSNRSEITLHFPPAQSEDSHPALPAPTTTPVSRRPVTNDASDGGN